MIDIPQEGVRTAERQKFLSILGALILAGNLVFRGMQIYHWRSIGWDMQSYNPYMPPVDFIVGHCFLATAIVASLPIAYYIAAFVNYVYDSIIIYGLVKWGYLSPTMAGVEVTIIIIEFVLIFYMIRRVWFDKFESKVIDTLSAGYK